ncbi:MAG: hypothetical protein ACO3JL_18835, partial [Myxococcota bacterium]
DFVAADFVTADFVAADFVTADFVAADFVAADFVAADFVAGAFVAGAFVAADFGAGAFVSADFVVADFGAADFVAGAFFTLPASPPGSEGFRAGVREGDFLTATGNSSDRHKLAHDALSQNAKPGWEGHPGGARTGCALRHRADPFTFEAPRRGGEPKPLSKEQHAACAQRREQR